MKKQELKFVIPDHKCCGNCKYLEHAKSVVDESFECKIKYKDDRGNELSMSDYWISDWGREDSRNYRWLYVCDLWEPNK